MHMKKERARKQKAILVLNHYSNMHLTDNAVINSLKINKKSL